MMVSEKKYSKKTGLLAWQDILPWQRDNEFILTGYRIASFSYSRSIQSIFEVHNETANIWSHLLGALRFLIGLINFLQLRSLHTNEFPTPDVAAVGLYYLCVVVCFILSTIFHVCSDHSAEMHRFGNELDHLGVVLVIWGTGISSTHFAFYCDSTLRHTYFLVLTSTALGCAIFTLQPKFRQPTYRTVRFLMYCFLGSSMFAPVIHGWTRFGWEKLDGMMDLASFFGLATINFMGALVYAVRIPERWFPRTFDLLGQSHNWMHVLVLTGALVRLNGLLVVVESWREHTSRHGLCQDIF